MFRIFMGFPVRQNTMELRTFGPSNQGLERFFKFVAGSWKGEFIHGICLLSIRSNIGFIPSFLSVWFKNKGAVSPKGCNPGAGIASGETRWLTARP